MTTTRIACKCQHCREYAERKGYAFPLAADVQERLVAPLRLNTKTPVKANHALVAHAYDVSIPQDHASRRAWAVK